MNICHLLLILMYKTFLFAWKTKGDPLKSIECVKQHRNENVVVLYCCTLKNYIFFTGKAVKANKKGKQNL